MQPYDFLPGWRIVSTYIQIEHAIGEWPFIFLLHVSSVSQSSHDRLIHPTCVVDASSHLPQLFPKLLQQESSRSHSTGAHRTLEAVLEQQVIIYHQLMMHQHCVSLVRRLVWYLYAMCV
jgi:hypothetical protein